MRESYRVVVPDYAKFKLFHLSVLWRASVAPAAPFDRFTIGLHEAAVKRMLQNETPGTPSDYPLFAELLLLKDEREIGPFLIPPYYEPPIESLQVTSTIFAGCVWHTLLSRVDVPVALSRRILRSDGKMRFECVDAWDVRGVQSLGTRYFMNAERSGLKPPHER